MHVAIVSHHVLPVRGYGGTQRIAAALVRGLVSLGHRVSLVAPPGTHLPGATHVPLQRHALRDPTAAVAEATPPGVDLVHTHFVVRDLPPGPPLLQTLYGNLRPDVSVPPNTVFLSANHAQRHGHDAFIYPGLDPAEFILRTEKDDYDLFLGRLHKIKGYHWAITGARRTRRRLLIAGGWRPSFFRRIRYVGSVDGRRKTELLAGARCLWMPALWDEPFGLTTIEALFSGTPVLGTRHGALPEVMTAEVGALCDTLEEMIEASRTIATRPPQACRAHAVRHFNHVRMAEDYVALYRHFLERGALPPGRSTPFAPAAP